LSGQRLANTPKVRVEIPIDNDDRRYAREGRDQELGTERARGKEETAEPGKRHGEPLTALQVQVVGHGVASNQFGVMPVKNNLKTLTKLRR